MNWLQGVHHDPSPLYVSNPLPRLGEAVRVRLRVPTHAPIQRVYIRTTPDGEVHMEQMRMSIEDTCSIWWEGHIRATMPLNNYRFKLFTHDAAYYLNAMGISRAEGLDHFDFKLLTDFTAPTWTRDSVIYHVFVDRFCNGDPDSDVKDGEWRLDNFPTRRRQWDEPPLSWAQGGNADFYGGDLPGVIQKLDYIQDLGANTVYLSPIFAAPSNHRYDTSDFARIDPHVGGDAALAALRRELDKRGMRLILDVVVNHVGVQHEWFTAARQNPKSQTMEYFTFQRHPDQYETWLGVKSLPKLNYRSEQLRDVMYQGADSVLRRWLREPYRIDGWRLDVFNMLAQQGETRLGHKVARGMRRAIKADNPQVYFFGEHFFDATPHLQGDEVDGVMNYFGFTFPLRRWLTTNTSVSPTWSDGRVDPSRLPGEALAEHWRAVRASIPWQVAVGQYNLLSSHDITRFYSAIDGDLRLNKLGATLLMTYPGTPGVYYGDEIGMEGGSDPDNRRPMVWDESRWNADLRAHYKQMIKLRRESPALIEGGFQELHADEASIVYQRQSADQRLIVVACRDAKDGLPISAVAAGLSDGDTLRDHLSGESYTVVDRALRLRGLDAGTVMVLEQV